MGRFDADTEADRLDLVVDAIRAHRDRGSAFTTVQTPAKEDEPEPWVQFDADASLLNLDCTDEELDRLEDLLEEFGGMTIHERASPDDLEGTNVRITARVDDERIAQFVEQCFRHVYDRPEDYRLWVTTI